MTLVVNNNSLENWRRYTVFTGLLVRGAFENVRLEGGLQMDLVSLVNCQR